MMKTIIITMTIGALFFIPVDVNSQIQVQDSSKMVLRTLVGVPYMQDSTELVKTQHLEKRNKERMADAKNERVQTRAKAKESQRISNDADDAAKQSRQAVRAEKRAQKFREKADKQAQKAEDARMKSDGND